MFTPESTRCNSTAFPWMAVPRPEWSFAGQRNVVMAQTEYLSVFYLYVINQNSP